MHHRIISTILVACLTLIWYPNLIKGQTIDSLLHILDNELVEDDAEKYDLLCQLIELIDDTESKISYCDQAIALAEKLDIFPALPYYVQGEAYLDVGKHASALACFIEEATYYEEHEVYSSLGRVYNSMAIVYNQQGDRDNEKIYLQKSSKIFEQENDSFRLAYALHNFGYFYYSVGQYDSALVVLTETLDLFKERNTPDAIYSYFVCLGNMGLTYSRLSDFDKAEDYLYTAIDTLKSYEDDYALPEFMIEYADILRQKGEIEQAVTYATRALRITDNPTYERDASRLLAKLYETAGRIDSAYHYLSIFVVANDSIRDIESVQRMAFLRTQYEIGKKQAEVDALEREKLIRTIVIIGLGIILFMAIWLVALYYTNLKRSRELTKALEERRILLENQSTELKEKNEELVTLNEAVCKQNERIKEANEELTVLNEAISKQKNEILDSITYARKIQAAMFPPEQYFHEILNDVFILFKPRDIVSGDFFWIKHVNQYVILAAADCTGHGVPGAFMSLLGISFLNEIVQRREVTEANQVLNELRRQIRNSLRQHGQAEESKDGIDMALCVINEKNNSLQYAGANNPLYLIRSENGAPELTEFKADRMPLGYYPGRFNSFTNQDIQLEYGDVFYLFSDGFMDQKGGKDNKKFMSKKFKNLLMKIHQEPMQEQKKILDKTITEWMGDNSQIDDILVIGVRV